MTTYQKEWILGILFVIVVILHVDFWAWGAIHPILFGVFPYTIWWGALITILVGLIFIWWNSWGWPEPPEEYERGLTRRDEVIR